MKAVHVLIAMCVTLSTTWVPAAPASEFIGSLQGEVKPRYDKFFVGELITFDISLTNTSQNAVSLPEFQEGLKSGAIQIDLVDPEGNVIPRLSVQYEQPDPEAVVRILPADSLVWSSTNARTVWMKAKEPGIYKIILRVRSLIVEKTVQVVAIRPEDVKKSVDIHLNGTTWADKGDIGRVILVEGGNRDWLIYQILGVDGTEAFARIASMSKKGEFIATGSADFVEIAYIVRAGQIEKASISAHDGTSLATKHHGGL